MPLVGLILVLGTPCGVPSARAEWALRRPGLDPRVVARHRAILQTDPGEPAALEALVSVYRRHSTGAALEAEYRRLAGPGCIASSSDGARSDLDPAACIVHGRLLQARGAVDQAEAALRRAASVEGPHAGVALEALGGLLQAHGRPSEAWDTLVSALERLGAGAPRRRTLEAVAALGRSAPLRAARPEARPLDHAIAALEELRRGSPRDDGRERALATALLEAGRAAEAAELWQSLAERARTGPPARTAEIWLRAAEAHQTAGHRSEALGACERALSERAAPIHVRMAAIDRLLTLAGQEDRHAIAARLERRWPTRSRGPAEWELLAGLKDQLGDSDGAARAYREVLTREPHRIDLRRRLIAALDRQGLAGAALDETRRLARIVPGDPRVTLDLVARLERDGSAAAGQEARALLRRLEGRTRSSAVLSTIAQRYAAWGQSGDALRVLQRVVRLEPDREQPLLDLAEQLFASGQREQALEKWQRLVDRDPSAGGWARLGAVLAEHDLAQEALATLRRGLDRHPGAPALRKELARLLERGGSHAQALTVWEDLYDELLAAPTPATAEEPALRDALTGCAARALHGRNLANRYRERAAGASPERRRAWARIGVEALLKAGQAEDAEAELAVALAEAPRGAPRAELLVARARIHEARAAWADAAAALREAAAEDPSRAPQLYPQISRISERAYQDADALDFARRTVALRPDDAEALSRLAVLLRERGDVGQAAATYARAIGQNPRSFSLHRDLARLELGRGRAAEASRLYHEIIRGADREDLVVDAARSVVDLDEYLGRLDDLERELFTVYRANPGRAAYRRLIVELVRRRLGPVLLLENAEAAALASPNPATAGSALGPLMDTLVSGEPRERLEACTMLARLGRSEAAAPLLRLARSSADPALAEAAAAAAARLSTAEEHGAWLELLGAPESGVQLLAAWTLARLGQGRARAALETLAQSSPQPEVRRAAQAALEALAAGSPVPPPGLRLSRLDGIDPSPWLERVENP